MNVQVKRIDHVNLRTGQLDTMIAWYGRVLGMEPGPRPGFSFPGAWLYADGFPIIHLVGRDATPDAAEEDLRLEHFALSAGGMKDLIARLDSAGEKYTLRPIEGFGIVQVNVWDPDGNHIHVDFPASEAESNLT